MTKTNIVTPASIRVVLDQMRAEIVHAFTGYEVDIKTQIDAAMKAEIDAFDFDGEVRRILRAELSRRVQYEITSRVSSVIHGQRIAKQISEIVADALSEQFGNDQT